MSKQEKIVCAAIMVSIVKDGYEGSRVVKGADWNSIVRDRIIDEIAHSTCCDGLTRGFITNKNRFVDQVEAMRISVNNKNRIDYEVSGEMDRLRKDLAKATASRNRGTIGVEAGLKLLEDKYFGLESVLNEFRGRNNLKPEDLY